jgi:ribosomal protein S18 acetylase RimI-like enzyme
MIRPLDHDRDAEACDAIIASLPDWFGLEEGIRDCAVAVRSETGLVAEEGGQVLAFLTWTEADGVAEITWMGAHVEHRREGLGRALVAVLLEELRTRDTAELRVKTLSSRHPDPGYAQTRAFYGAVGFVEVAELDIWGPENPCVLLSMRL